MKFADKEIGLRWLYGVLLAIGYLKERLLWGGRSFLNGFALFLLLDLPKVVHAIGTIYYYGLTSFRKQEEWDVVPNRSWLPPTSASMRGKSTATSSLPCRSSTSGSDCLPYSKICLNTRNV